MCLSYQLSFREFVHQWYGFLYDTYDLEFLPPCPSIHIPHIASDY